MVEGLAGFGRTLESHTSHLNSFFTYLHTSSRALLMRKALAKSSLLGCPRLTCSFLIRALSALETPLGISTPSASTSLPSLWSGGGLTPPSSSCARSKASSMSSASYSFAKISISPTKTKLPPSRHSSFSPSIMALHNAGGYCSALLALPLINC